MTEVTAIGHRDGDGVRVGYGADTDEFIPYLGQWVRDYVDKRHVTDGMAVLVATVAESGDEVDALVINSKCATEFAKSMATYEGKIQLSDDL